jgi:hypothetical protein
LIPTRAWAHFPIYNPLALNTLSVASRFSVNFPAHLPADTMEPSMGRDRARTKAATDTTDRNNLSFRMSMHESII